MGVQCYELFGGIAPNAFLDVSCDKNQTYIGKTKRHLATRVREHFSGNSAIF